MVIILAGDRDGLRSREHRHYRQGREGSENGEVGRKDNHIE